jgi:hypothetical protein
LGETVNKATHKSARCPLCGCVVVVWRRKGLKASLLRTLAVADHIKVQHPDEWRFALTGRKASERHSVSSDVRDFCMRKLGITT